MIERLIVKNFLELKDIDMEVGDINILIGPQASGKSLCAKLLYFFKNEVIYNFFVLYNFKRDRGNIKIYLMSKFYEFFPDNFSNGRSFQIRYEISKEYIEINRNEAGESSISFSDIFIDRVEKYFQTDKGYQNLSFFDQHNSYLRKISEGIGITQGFEQYFIPAARSFYAFHHRNIYKSIKNKEEPELFITEFGDFYEDLKGRLHTEDLKGRLHTIGNSSKELGRINALMNNILKGEYKRVGDQDYIKLNDRMVHILYASSGQQASLPIVLILYYYIMTSQLNLIESFGATIYIEEPEAHLFPESQKDMVELIASTYNLSETPLQFFITTHSPYILTSLNNLLHAGIVRKKIEDDKEKLQRLYEFIPRERIFDIEKVKAYTIKDGKLEDIKNSKYEIISADPIDDVSIEIESIFGKLFDLEFK